MEIYQSFWILRCANALHNNYTVLFREKIWNFEVITVRKCVVQQLHRNNQTIARVFYGVVETFLHHVP